MNFEAEPQNSDVYTLIRKRRVSVTPLTLDMTARVDENVLNHFAGQGNRVNAASS
jgi:broad specificity polyphosphatase/5'/3'-nucleotidase SurE